MQSGSPVLPDTSALERLPHLARQICDLWDKEEIDSRLNGLIMDSRDGRRQGLPLEVVGELLFLVEFLIAKRALYASETTGMPFGQAFRLHLEKSRRFTAFRPEETTDPWSNPRDRRESGRVERRDHDAAIAPAARPQHGRALGKKSWWRRLVG